MDTMRAVLTRWSSRVAVVVGLLLGGWLLVATSAAATSGATLGADGRPVSDLAHELVDRTLTSDLDALLANAAHGVVSDPADSTPAQFPQTGSTQTGSPWPGFTRPGSTQDNSSQDESTQDGSGQQGAMQAGTSFTEPEPAESEPAESGQAGSSSSASGSASSTPGVEVRPTITYGGVDYGPAPGSAPGTPSTVLPEAAPVAEAVRPAAPPPPAKPAPPAPTPASTSVRAYVSGPVVSVVDRAETTVDSTGRGERTAPANRPTQPPTPPAPAAPASGTSMSTWAHDGGGQARGSHGVLATRAHAATPAGGWPVSDPQVDDATGSAADTPASRPD
ncbi:hypothetical protein ACTG9Q_03220 [Actinokineospora sp. 24-640]